MADRHFFKKNAITIAHLPTWMLIIGYPLFWGEVMFSRHNYGVTTPLAWLLWGLLSLYVVRQAVMGNPDGVGSLWSFFVRQPWPVRGFIFLGSFLCCFVLAVAFRAAFLPPHLTQELDVLNYHYTVPRQHLIRNSLAHIPWSTGDLFPLPVQFALSPFWFATTLPNKLPQFIFLVGLVFIAVNLLRQLNKEDPLRIFLIVFAVFGAHHVGIQTGTAMLDLILCYLILAALDSFLKGNSILAAVEFAFYFWSKSFHPIHVGGIAIAMFFILKMAVTMNFSVGLSFNTDGHPLTAKVRTCGRKFILAAAVLSVLIGGPFVLKSFYYSGTPIYPLYAGLIPVDNEIRRNPRDWDIFMAATRKHLTMRDAYGYGRSAEAFLKHLWLIAVPEKGVNNKYDYPVGLVYLICLGPFLFFLIRDIFRKRISVLPLFIILFWLSWWLGSHQTRFLFIPFVLMYILVCADIKKTSVVLQGALVIALLLNAISVYRAHQNDLWKEGQSVLRKEDRKVVKLNRQYIASGREDIVPGEFSEIAFAQFPVNLTKERLPFVIMLSGDRDPSQPAREEEAP